MKQYSLYHFPVLSFYSKNLYRDVAHNWKGFCFLYLFLLLLVTGLPTGFKLHVMISDYVENEVSKLISQFPTLTITNGKASIEEPQPYFIADPDNEEPFLVIDTKGKISSLADTEAKGLITETHLIFKPTEIETRTFNFEAVEKFVLDQERLYRWADRAKTIIAPLLYLFLLGISFAVRIIQVLLFGVIGLFFSRMTRSFLSYPSLIRLSVVAISPCLIFRTILNLANTSFPYDGLTYFLAALGFLYFGVKSATEETPENSGVKSFPQG